MAGEGGRGQVGGKGKEPLSESKEPLDTTLGEPETPNLLISSSYPTFYNNFRTEFVFVPSAGLLQEKKDEHAEGVVNKGFDIVDGGESGTQDASKKGTFFLGVLCSGSPGLINGVNPFVNPFQFNRESHHLQRQQ
jgi:hypothetical protein